MDNEIQWEDGAVCYADGQQWRITDDLNLKSNGTGSLIDSSSAYLIKVHTDFQLNEIRTGDFLPASELGTEQKYNDVVDVFGLFGFEEYSANSGFKKVHNFKGLGIVDGDVLNADLCRRQLTYSQVMAIGELKRMMDERESVKSTFKTEQIEINFNEVDYLEIKPESVIEKRRNEGLFLPKSKYVSIGEIPKCVEVNYLSGAKVNIYGEDAERLVSDYEAWANNDVGRNKRADGKFNGLTVNSNGGQLVFRGDTLEIKNSVDCQITNVNNENRADGFEGDCGAGEENGFSCDYYKAPITTPTTASEPYTAECNDVIEVLDMTYAEANMFKEIWRTAAARTLGKQKAGHTSKRGAEKIIFFAERHGVKHGVIKG